jgi:uncharacterized protein (TIGR02266 family)
METFLKLSRILLERSGYEIIMAKSGAEAIKKVQLEQPKLVFIDLIMPDMNGDAVCRFIKSNKITRHIPVIMVTTKSDAESRGRCEQAGCDDYITKPVTQRNLFEKINTFIPLERRRHPRASLRMTSTASGKSMTVSDFTSDVSEDGVFIETDNTLAIGTMVELEFGLPGEPEAIRARGRVARLVSREQSAPGQPAGIGIHFTEIAPGDTAKIKSYVEKTLPKR